MTEVRRVLWVLGFPARTLLIAAIRLYRVTLSHALGGRCRFFPSCSHYAEGAIRARGAIAGTVLAVWRVARCNPFGSGGVDLAPGRLSTDVVIHGARQRSTQREVRV